MRASLFPRCFPFSFNRSSRIAEKWTRNEARYRVSREASSEKGFIRRDGERYWLDSPRGWTDAGEALKRQWDFIGVYLPTMGMFGWEWSRSSRGQRGHGKCQGIGITEGQGEWRDRTTSGTMIYQNERRTNIVVENAKPNVWDFYLLVFRKDSSETTIEKFFFFFLFLLEKISMPLDLYHASHHFVVRINMIVV